MSEEWMPVVGFEGWYEVSDAGRVRSVERTIDFSDGRVRVFPSVMLTLKNIGRNREYRMVCLKQNDKARYRTVHRLVLDAFVGPCPAGQERCHCDGNPSNNSLSNLRYDTRSANHLDKRQHGTMIRGSSHHMAKLTEDQVRDIRRTYQPYGHWNHDRLAKKFGVSPALIGMIINRDVWIHVV